jgi:hypothetical protein
MQKLARPLHVRAERQTSNLSTCPAVHAACSPQTAGMCRTSCEVKRKTISSVTYASYPCIGCLDMVACQVCEQRAALRIIKQPMLCDLPTSRACCSTACVAASERQLQLGCHAAAPCVQPYLCAEVNQLFLCIIKSV